MSGRARFRNNQFDEAITEFNKLITRFPSHPLADDASYAIADSYYNRGEYDLAINQYKKLMVDYPKSDLTADAITGIQWSLMQKGETAQAANTVQAYIRQLPDQTKAAELLQRQAELFANNQQAQEAIATYQKILTDYPQSVAAANAHFNVGQCWEKLNDRNAAMTSYRQQWQSYPQAERSADALLALGQLCYEEKKYDQAIDHLQKLRQAFPRHEKKNQAGYLIGLSYLHNGEADRAQTFFEQAAQGESDEGTQAMALLGLARVHYQQNHYDQAKATLDKALDKADKTVGPEALFLLGDLQRRQGQWQEATVAYLKIKYLYPGEANWIAAGLYQAGQCYEEQNKIGDARRLYQTILNEYPAQKEYVTKAQARLQALVGR